MKKVLAIIVLALIASLAIAQKSITFVVDENLAPIEESNKYLFDGERLVNSILYDENIPKEAYHIVATSFADAQCMKSTIRGHFPNTIVRGIGSLEDQLVSSKVSKPQKAKNAKTVKSGDKISGTVSDEAGPLMGATVCEIDSNGRIVNLAVTDMNGEESPRPPSPQLRRHEDSHRAHRQSEEMQDQDGVGNNHT